MRGKPNSFLGQGPGRHNGGKRRGGAREGGGNIYKKARGKGCEGIFNLRGVVLTDSEKFILSKGLIFAPKKPLNKFQTFIDVQKYMRKLSIK